MYFGHSEDAYVNSYWNFLEYDTSQITKKKWINNKFIFHLQ